MGKIEPDCLAMTFNCIVPENNGKVVKVIKFVGVDCALSGRRLAGDSRWQTDTVFRTQQGSTTNSEQEECLMRIDGYDASEDESNPEELPSELRSPF